MALKHHTIIIVPHARARFRKLRVTNRQLAIAASAAILLLGVSVFTTVTFFTNEIDRGQLDSISRENADLREVNRSFEESIRSLEKQLADFEEQTRQLSIVAGLEASTESETAGVGGEENLAPGTSDLADLDSRATVLAGRLDGISRQFESRRQWIASTPTIAPVKGVLTSGYGYRKDPFTGARAAHFAIDISTAPGQAVLAPADAVVVRSGWNGGLGKCVYLSHGYGVTTRFGHLSRIVVEPGQKVHRGDVLGYVGSTGRSTGTHLHYEVREEGKPVNPLGYILDGTAAGS